MDESCPVTRRLFVTGSLAMIAAPLVAEAQPAAKIARIGWLGDKPAGNPHLRAAFLQGLRADQVIE